ncbi:MAG: hypothetical protein IBX44_02590 [Sulfurospirillum sp.]|nr:hypothetical protein [Sulfurospirillum sp.]
MNILGIGSIIESVGKVADNLFTSDKERLDVEIQKESLRLQEKQIEAGTLNRVHDTNIAEAQHRSVFVAGWRPFIGWVGGMALVYSFIIYPLFLWGNAIWWQVAPPPSLDSDFLFNIILAMLGVAGMRTFEKARGLTK